MTRAVFLALGLVLLPAPGRTAETPAPGRTAETPAPAAPLSSATFSPVLSPALPSGTQFAIDPQRFGPLPALGQPVETDPSAQPSPGAAPAAASLPGPGLDPQRFGQRPPDDAYGAFQRGFYKTAYTLALPRAEQADGAAQTLVAEILARGLGVRQDEKAAADWYARAAAHGVPDALFQYALILLEGRLVPKNPARGQAMMRQAADAGSALAQFNVAQSILDKDRGPAGLARAAVYYEMAAKGGLADAQYALSQLYAEGEGGKPMDQAEARRWLERAARQGYDTAQLDLATLLVEDRRGPDDEKAGFAWMTRAAAGGNVAARNRLAKLYVNGIGVEGDEVEGAAWYILAHRAGLNDPDMDDVLNGLTDEQVRQANERADRLR